jgi:hypothetical protein
MKRKLQTVNEHQAHQQNLQSLKPVPQFVIPPIAPMQRSSSSLSNIVSRENPSPPLEPSPKRLRLDDSILINSGINALKNAQPPQNAEVM